MMLNFSLLPTKLKYHYKTQPYSHQKRALAKIQKLDGKCALFMEMGTGKTKVAIDWAGIGFHNYEIRRVLVVAPLSVLGVWPRQIRQHSDVPSRIYRLRGSTSLRLGHLASILRVPDETKLTYVLINYESLWRKHGGRSIESYISRWKPDLVIFDESHRIKSPTAKQSKAAWRIAREARQRLILTGTPITKAPLDIFGQFRALNSDIFGDNWYQFKFTYGIWGGAGKYLLLKYRNLDLLIQQVRANSFRIKKTQCLDLPEKLFQDVPVTLSDKAMKLYKEMSEKAIIEIEETHATATIVLTKILRLQQITSGFIKDVDGVIRRFDDAKLNTCKDLLDDVLEEGHKVVIFFRFIDDIKRVEEHLLNRGITHRILSGSVPDEERDSIMAEFQDDPKVKIFLAQVQTGSEGIELFAGSVIIYYSMSNSLLHWMQSQDRVHRPGQTKKVMIYRLIANAPVDRLTYTALDQKKKIADVVIHDPVVLRAP